MTLPPVAIANARLPGYPGLHWVDISENGVISRILPLDVVEQPLHRRNVNLIDLHGDWLSLGGIDLQINGALGLAFPDLTEHDVEKLDSICQFLWQQGVDAFLPTLVTTSVENIHRALQTLTRFNAQQVEKPGSTIGRSQLFGAHLEGPFLNPDKRGAHPLAFIQPLTLDRLKQVIDPYQDVVKIVTLAPEMDADGTAIPYLKSNGITVSLGHSQATAQQAYQAFQQGASMVTHAFNAMPGLHHREPGLLGAALTHPSVFCGLIADGQHVSSIMVDLLLRMGRGRRSPSPYPKGLFLVSDALSPLGLPDGTYPWDDRQIQVTHGTARLPDGTLSGTTLPLLVGVQRLVEWGIASVGEAIALATEAPRDALGLPGLSVGRPAHLLRWHHDDITQTLTWQRLVLYE